jgi:hypothetical protein
MYSHQVPKVFPSGSQSVPQIPNVFPKTFPIAFHFVSHIVLVVVQLPCVKLVKGGTNKNITKHSNIWGRKAYLDFFVGECPKLLVMCQWNGSF